MQISQIYRLVGVSIFHVCRENLYTVKPVYNEQIGAVKSVR